MSDDSDNDDDLLTTSIFRSNNRRRTLAQKKNENTIDELIRNSKQQFDEAKRIQQLQVENKETEKVFEKIQEEMMSSTVKRKVENIQSGFFEVEESEELDIHERKRRTIMLQNMKGRYDNIGYSSLLVFKPDTATKSKFYFSLQQCTEDLRSILLETHDIDPKLKQAFTSALEDQQLQSVLHVIQSANVRIPTAISVWMFRVALSEGIADIGPVGSAGHNALISLIERQAVDMTDSIFHMDTIKNILYCWDEVESDADLSSNRAGLVNFLRIVYRLPCTQSHEQNVARITIQEKFINLCAHVTKSNEFRDTDILHAVSEMQLAWSTRLYEDEDIEQLAYRMLKDSQSVQDPWGYYPSVAKLVPCFGDDEKVNIAACSINIHMNMQVIRHCLNGDVTFDDQLIQAFKLIDANEDVDLVQKPLHMKALFSSYTALQAIRSNLEETKSSKEADSRRCFAIGQTAVLLFVSGILLLGSSVQKEEDAKEYGTKQTMRCVFSLCDKLSSPLDFLTVYSNKYSAVDHFRRLNCWLMVFDFYRLETLKKLRPKFEDDSLIQKNLTSFFSKVSA